MNGGIADRRLRAIAPFASTRPGASDSSGNTFPQKSRPRTRAVYRANSNSDTVMLRLKN